MNMRDSVDRKKWGKKSLAIFATVFIMSLFATLSGYALDVVVDENSDIIQNSILNDPQSYQFVGGDIAAGSAGFTVERLKYGRHSGFDRLVVCIKKRVYDDEASPAKLTHLSTARPPRYKFALSADKMKAELRISAYHSKVDALQLNKAAGGELIRKIKEVKFYDWRWYFISFTQPVDINVFDLGDPGRVVLDIRPNR